MKTISRQTVLTFRKTPRRSCDDTAMTCVWESRCGRWRVVRRRSLYQLPTTWVILQLDPRFHVWDVVGRHRTKQAAFRAVEQHASVTYPGGS